MDLKDAIDWPSDQNQGQGGGMWPGQPSNSQFWPDPNPQPSNPIWQGGNTEGGMWGNPKAPSGPSAPGWNNPTPVAQKNLNVPYKERIFNGIQGKVITIDGIVKPNPNKLTVDLLAGQEVVFHFNPRFKDEVDGKVIVMNSCSRTQQWGCEERDRQHFPFAPGQSFQIKIRCTGQGFQVRVNNRDLPTYKHRANPGSVDTLTISNDLSLSRVDIE